MLNVRLHCDLPPAGSRFNVLLTEDRLRRPDHWSRQLPRLMEPMGVQSYLVHSGQEAMALAERTSIHAAVIDLATPRIAPTPGAAGAIEHRAADMPGGLWILELFRRLRQTPPVVLVRSRAIMQRDVDRLLRDALRLGAFTVLEHPVNLESLLLVFRRLVDRWYHGAWPVRSDDLRGDEERGDDAPPDSAPPPPDHD